MLIIPAIDLKDGQCVRLKQGLMDEATIFSSSPGEQAAHWLAQGARRNQQEFENLPVSKELQN